MKNGHIKRITDNDICSSVIEIMGTNISTTYITCPEDPKQTLGIKLPFLVMIIKNVSDNQAKPRVFAPAFFRRELAALCKRASRELHLAARVQRCLC